MKKPINPDRAPTLFDISELVVKAKHTDIFLTPNHRLARHVKFAWEEKLISMGRKNWPQIESLHWEIWLKTQWERAILVGLIDPVTLLNPNVEREIWRRVILEDQMKELSFNLVDVSTTVENAIRTRKIIQRNRLNLKDSGIKSRFLLEEDCASYLRWESIFRKHLSKNNIITLEDSIAHLSKVQFNLPRDATANLVEFDSVPPILSDYLHSQGVKVINQKQQKTSNSSHHVTSYVSKQTELQAVARWVFKTSREDNNVTIGVVLDDTKLERQRLEHLLRREFNCLDDSYYDLPINFSTLITLNQAPLIRDALRILKLVVGAISFSNFISLLQSRFITKFKEPYDLQSKIINALNRDDSDQIELSEILDALKRLSDKNTLLDEELLTELNHLNQVKDANSSHITSSWSSFIDQCLSVFGWPGIEAPDSFEQRQYELWQKLMSGLVCFDSVLGKITCSEAIDVLYRSSTKQPFQTETEGRRIHILGRLEAAGLSFDQLWITSIDGDHWSAVTKKSAFIPISIQKHLDTTGNDSTNEADHRDLLDDYTRLNKSIFSSFVENDNNQNMRCTKLPNISEIRPDRSKWKTPIAWNKAAARLSTIFQTEQLPRILNLELRDIKGGSRLIEDQSLCPLRAFLRHRCKLNYHKPFSLGLSSLDRGKLMHAGLFYFWGRIQSHSELIELDDKQIKKFIKEALDEGFQQFLKSSHTIPRQTFILWERQRLNELLWEWISFEKTRSPFKVISREEKFDIECLDTSLKISIDRIDLLEDGSYLIVDYKSSLQNLSDWFGSHPKKPQLPLYAAFLPNNDGIGFAEVKKDNCRINGLIRQVDKGVVNLDPNTRRSMNKEMNWDSQIEIWKETILNLLKDFINGQKEIELTSGSCKNCAFDSICRINSSGG